MSVFDQSHASRVALMLAVGATGCGEPNSGITDWDIIASVGLGLQVCDHADGNEPLAGLTFAGTKAPNEADDLCARAPRDLVYEVTKEGYGEVADSVTLERGRLSAEDEERLERPWLYADRDAVLVQGFWGGTDESGRIFRGRRVEQIRVSPAVPAPIHPARHEVTDELREAREQAESDAPLSVVIRVHSPMRRVPLPSVPSREEEAEDLDAYNRALEARAVAASAQNVAFESEVALIVREIESSGGSIDGFNASTRSINATLPSNQLARVAALAKVDRIHGVHQLVGAASITLGYDSDGSDQGQRDDDHIGQVGFGYSGEVGSGNPIKVAVTEAWGLEDEACMFDDDGNNGDACDPTERLKRTYKCNASNCNSLNFSVTDEEGEGGHGTKVTSVLAAGYTQSQTNPNTGTEPTLDADWRQLASGMAREVTIDYAMATTESALTKAYDCLGGDTTKHQSCREVEVVNSSMGWGDPDTYCTLTSSKDYEDALEHLWDDGPLPVVAAHNQVSGTACRVLNPGDTPMAFTVGAVDGDDSLDYDDWPLSSLSAFGGADGTFGSTSKTGTISVIDLVAGGDMTYRTARQTGNNGGTIETTTGNASTSFSTPLVAGAAALVKEYRLATGDTWINQAGFLEAHLLAMGDRYSTGNGAPGCVVGGYSVCGFDRGSGAGRLKLQAPVNWMWSAYVVTFTGTSSANTYEFSMPIPSGSAMVKCVMTQREPMESKSNFSLVSLAMKIRDKVGGQCLVNSGSTDWTRGEGYWDTKHHVTTLASEVSIGNRCADIDIDPAILSSDGAVTTYTYCYTSPQLEHG